MLRGEKVGIISHISDFGVRAIGVLAALLMAIFAGCGSEPQPQVSAFPSLPLGSYTGLMEEAAGPNKLFLYLRVLGEERAVWALSGASVEYGVARISGSRALKLSYGSLDMELFGAVTSSDSWKGETLDGHYHWRLQAARRVAVPQVSESLRNALIELSELGVDLNLASQREPRMDPKQDPPTTVGSESTEQEGSVCGGASGDLGAMVPALRKQRDALLAKRTTLSDAFAKHGLLSAKGRLVALGRLYLQREAELRQMRVAEKVVNSSSFREERAAALQAEIDSEKERILELGGVLE